MLQRCCRSLCIKNNSEYKPEDTSEVYQPYNESRDGAHVQPGRLAKSNDMLDYGYNPQAENDYFRSGKLRYTGYSLVDPGGRQRVMAPEPILSF